MQPPSRFTARAREILSDPQRQAIAYSAMGILGLMFAAIGFYLLLGGGGGDGASQASPGETASPSATAPATPTRTPTRTPTPSPTPTKTPTPAPTPTATSTAQPEVRSGGSSSPPPTPVPTATPTTPAIVAGGPYCNASGSLGGPPVRVFGTLAIEGAAVPAGTNVSLSFDGVFGPAKFTSDTGGYAIDFFAGGTDCANRQGAAIAVVVNGRFFATGYKVGDGAAGFIRFDINAP